MNERPYGIDATYATLARDRAELFLRLSALHGWARANAMMFWPGASPLER